MEQGTVKWFNDVKGYGFIQGPSTSDGKDIFVHYTEIENGTLREGDMVNFEMEEGKKGAFAREVKMASV